uniref:Cysteine and serine rich nuclear protein 2 n=1 Tax=Takifugu rubripes TaxID=31033 RepID=H2UMA0_TAKRU
MCSSHWNREETCEPVGIRVPVCAPDTAFPWRKGRLSASKEDMKRWKTALHSPRSKTPTMTSPAATVPTAATASTPPPAPHLPVSNTALQEAVKQRKKVHSVCHLSLSPPPPPPPATSILRQHKPSPGGKRVRFDVVTVYYFPRRQGFTSVPSQGGSSLGMARHHSSIRHYTLGEFAHEQETSHRHVLRQHLRQEKLNARKLKLTRNGTVECTQADLLTLEDVSDEDLDVDAVEVDDCFFLQPLPTKRRRALLRASGIARIDAREKAELRSIRLSREECGCDCRLYCDPRHCGCSQAGIKCQVDRLSFPCGCSRDGCGNMAGRIEFNPLRVRTHYLHTIMKLDLEKRRMLIHGSEDQYADSESLSSPSSACSTFSDLSSGSGLDSEMGEGQVQTEVEVRDLLAEQDILERENETAVLHLQSAEEQERREREEAEGEAVQQELAAGLADQNLCILPEQAEEPAVDQVLLQGPFPTGTTVLCITDNQEESPSELIKDSSSSLLYYQLSPIEPAAFEALPRAEEAQRESAGGRREGGEESKGDTHEDVRQSSSEERVEVEKERPSGPQQNLPEEQGPQGSSSDL